PASWILPEIDERLRAKLVLPVEVADLLAGCDENASLGKVLDPELGIQHRLSDDWHGGSELDVGTCDTRATRDFVRLLHGSACRRARNDDNRGEDPQRSA